MHPEIQSTQPTRFNKSNFQNLTPTQVKNYRKPNKAKSKVSHQLRVDPLSVVSKQLEQWAIEGESLAFLQLK